MILISYRIFENSPKDLLLANTGTIFLLKIPYKLLRDVCYWRVVLEYEKRSFHKASLKRAIHLQKPSETFP